MSVEVGKDEKVEEGGMGEKKKWLVGCLLALRPSDMLLYLRDGPAQTIVCAATLR